MQRERQSEAENALVMSVSFLVQRLEEKQDDGDCDGDDEASQVNTQPAAPHV